MSTRSQTGLFWAIMIGLTLGLPLPGWSAPPKRQPIYIDDSTVGFWLSTQLYCLEYKTLGITKKTKGGVAFTSLAKAIKQAKKKNKPNLVKKYQRLKKKQSECKDPAGGMLEPYKGPFTEKEARRLLRAATWAAPAARVADVVKLGVDKAVDALLAPAAPEAVLEAQMDDLLCDGYFSNEDENETCNEGPDDLSFEGLRFSLIHYFLNTGYPARAKLFLFLHDHMAASVRVLDGCERHAATEYVDMLRQTAADGDLISLLEQAVQSHHLHGAWLSGGLNSKYLPNEDFGREFLELFTVGKRDLDGNPRYPEAMIPLSAKAFTGHTIDYYSIGEDLHTCYMGFVPGLHDNSPKVLWAGTPYEGVAYGSADMLELVRRHPGLSEFWAKNLWLSYVNHHPTKAVIQRAAEELRRSDYNLIALLKLYLKSSAFYTASSRNTVYKYGVAFIIDLIKSLELPQPASHDFYSEVSGLMADNGQTILNPPTVFGWYSFEDNYAGERYIVARRNAAVSLISWSEESMEEIGYDFYAKFLPDRPSWSVLAGRLADQLGLSPLTAGQLSAIEQFMNYTPDWQGELERDAYDPVPGSENAVYKAQGLAIMLAGMPDFGLN